VSIRRYGDDLLLHFTALRGLRTFYTGRAEYHRAMEMGAESLRVAQQSDDPMLLAEGYFKAGAPLDVTCRSHMSIVLWLLGYPDQARQ